MTMKTSDESYIRPENLNLLMTDDHLKQYQKYMTHENCPEWFGDFLPYGIEPKVDADGNLVQTIEDISVLLAWHDQTQNQFKSGDQIFRRGKAINTIPYNDTGYNMRSKGLCILDIPARFTPEGVGDIKNLILHGNTTLQEANKANMSTLPTTRFVVNQSFNFSNIGAIGLMGNDAIRNQISSPSQKEDIKAVLQRKFDEDTLVYSEENKKAVRDTLTEWCDVLCKNQNIRQNEKKQIVDEIFRDAELSITGKQGVYLIDANDKGKLFNTIRKGRIENNKIVRESFLDTQSLQWAWVKGDVVDVWRMIPRRKDVLVNNINFIIHFGSDLDTVDPMGDCIKKYDKLVVGWKNMKDVGNVRNNIEHFDSPYIIERTGKNFNITHVYIQPEDFRKYGVEPKTIVTIEEFRVAMGKFIVDNQLSIGDTINEDEDFVPEYSQLDLTGVTIN